MLIKRVGFNEPAREPFIRIPVIIDPNTNKVTIDISVDCDFDYNMLVKKYNLSYQIGKEVKVLSDDVLLYMDHFYNIVEAYMVIQDSDGTEKYKLHKMIEEYVKDTFICKCNDCGKIYVIKPSEVNWYNDAKLRIPVVRCEDCRLEKKNHKYDWLKEI